MQQLCHPKIRCKSDMIPYYLLSICKNFIDQKKKKNLKLKQKECNHSTGEEYKRQCQKKIKERIHTHTETQTSLKSRMK